MQMVTAWKHHLHSKLDQTARRLRGVYQHKRPARGWRGSNQRLAATGLAPTLILASFCAMTVTCEDARVSTV